MPYISCSCGKTWEDLDPESVRTVLSRCEATHPPSLSLDLKDCRVTLANTLFLIMSLESTHHHDRQLVKELKDLGARHIRVVRGVVCGSDAARHKGRPVIYNKICHFSVRFKWMRAARQELLRRRYASIVYLEATVHIKATWEQILSTIRENPAKDIFWLAYRRLHRPRHRGPNFLPNNIEGSKCILMRRGGLRLFSRVVTESRMYHFDMMLSANLPKSRTFMAPESMFSLALHSSICGKGRRGKKAVRRR